MERSVLYLSHILVQHERSSPRVSFSAVDWRSAAPPSKRGRLEALNLAHQLAVEATSHPSRFMALAGEHSDDVTNRDLGGSLGRLSAAQLQLWPQVLDCIAAMPAGSVSPFVETEFGFHVFYRAAPPAPQVVTGSHIVIAHDSAPWIRILARSEVPKRSRAEAWARAREVYEKARMDPGAFEHLVGQYSEHEDAARKGDFGSWQSDEPTFLPREVAVLERLEVGEVAAPIETLMGLQIIKREPNIPREDFAMLAIRGQFDSTGSDAAHAQTAVRDEIERVAQIVRDAPEKFPDLVREYHGGREQWQAGRGTPALESHLARLELGEIGAEPVLAEFSYVVAQRVAPEPAPRALFDLPRPAEASLFHVLSAMPQASSRALLEERGAAIMHPKKRESVGKLIDEGWRALRVAPSYQQRLVTTAELLLRVAGTLGDVEYRRFVVGLYERAVAGSHDYGKAPSGSGAVVSHETTSDQ